MPIMEVDMFRKITLWYSLLKHRGKIKGFMKLYKNLVKLYVMRKNKG